MDMARAKSNEIECKQILFSKSNRGNTHTHDPDMFAILLTARAGSGKDTLASIFERRNGAINLKIARPLKDACADILERVFGLPRDRASHFVEQDKNQPVSWKDAILQTAPAALAPTRMTLYSVFASRFKNVEDLLLMTAAEDLASQFFAHKEEAAGAGPGPTICGKELTGRRLAQNLGTIFKERCGDDFWTQRACDEIINVSGCGDSKLCRPIVVTDLRFPSEADNLSRTLDFLCIPKVIVRIRRETPTADKNACPADSDVSMHPSELAMESIQVDAEIRNDAETPEAFQEAAYETILKLIAAKQEPQE